MRLIPYRIVDWDLIGFGWNDRKSFLSFVFFFLILILNYTVTQFRETDYLLTLYLAMKCMWEDLDTAALKYSQDILHSWSNLWKKIKTWQINSGELVCLSVLLKNWVMEPEGATVDNNIVIWTGILKELEGVWKRVLRK